MGKLVSIDAFPRFMVGTEVFILEDGKITKAYINAVLHSEAQGSSVRQGDSNIFDVKTKVLYSLREDSRVEPLPFHGTPTDRYIKLTDLYGEDKIFGSVTDLLTALTDEFEERTQREEADKDMPPATKPRKKLLVNEDDEDEDD